MHTFADDRGRSLMSVYDHVADIPGQVNVSTMYAGAVKAWHRHALQTDFWTVARGNLKIGVFNSGAEPLPVRLLLGGPTPGTEARQTIELPPQTGKAVFLGEHRPGVLEIPPGVWHGGVAVGGTDAVLIYYVTRKYNPRQPDEERAAWDAFEFDWGIEFK